MTTTHQVDLFNKKMKDVYDLHHLEYSNVFSNTDIFESSNFEFLANKFKEYIADSLSDLLQSNHQFLSAASVRTFNFDNNKTIHIALINEQSREWYGSNNSQGSFDFLVEDKKGLFKKCERFLDLGGHHFIWAIYYSMNSSSAYVKVVEPSILNVAIGLFNCLINNALQKIDVCPFAVTIKKSSEKFKDEDKMLVDFITTPVKTFNLDKNELFDFVKVDIEGYEYELLQDATFINIVKNSQSTHLELHLGHLVKRNINYTDCCKLMRLNNLAGVELYTETDMYQYLEKSNKVGFYAFIIK